MKKFIKQMVLVILFVFAMAMAMPVHASAKTVTKKICLTYYEPKKEWLNENVLFSSMYRYSIKSSQPSVASVKRKYSSDIYTYFLNCRKPGHTTVTLKRGKNKYITKITVKKFANPIKSFNIGKKTYGSRQFHYWHKVFKNTPKGTQKIKIKLKSGWKLGQFVSGWYDNIPNISFDTTIESKNKYIYVYKDMKWGAFKKNGTSIDMNKCIEFCIHAYNKKTKQPIVIIIEIK